LECFRDALINNESATFGTQSAGQQTDSAHCHFNRLVKQVEKLEASILYTPNKLLWLRGQTVLNHWLDGHGVIVRGE
jgi:hypothetical protein